MKFTVLRWHLHFGSLIKILRQREEWLKRSNPGVKTPGYYISPLKGFMVKKRKASDGELVEPFHRALEKVTRNEKVLGSNNKNQSPSPPLSVLRGKTSLREKKDLLIQLSIQNILLHLIRQQVFYRMSFLNGLADKSGGDIQKRSFDGFDFGMLKPFGISRAGIDKNLVIVQNGLMVFPLLEVGQIIRTKKQTKLMLWMLVAQISERIDRIAWLGHPKLNIAGPKVEMIRYR